MPPVTGLCMSPPEIKAGIDAGREERRLRAHLPVHCVQQWWGRGFCYWAAPQGQFLSPSHTVKSRSFQHVVMQTEHEVFCCHTWTRGREQGSAASHLPMTCSIVLGSLLSGWRQPGCSHLRCWQSHCFLYQAWYLSQSHGACLKLGYDMWLKVLAGLMNPKMPLWLQNHQPFGPL